MSRQGGRGPGHEGCARHRERRSRRARLWRPAGLGGGLILLLAVVQALPGNARRDGDAPLTYRAREVASLEALEPTSAGGHWSGLARRPVTDLILRLRPWSAGSVEEALKLPGNRRAGPDRALFAAELILAAGGRIHIEERAACGPWDGDVAICRTECDGGAFALKRHPQGDGTALGLVIGRAAAIADAGFGETVRLGACADGDGGGGLAPRSGRVVSEIELVLR